MLEAVEGRGTFLPVGLDGSSTRNFEGWCARCDKGMLFSFKLLSLRGLLSGGFDHNCVCGLYLGMRLGFGRVLEASDVPVPCERDGRSGSGESDLGSDTQSSDSESNQALSILVSRDS
jgi:hypothetical protein